MEKHRRSSFGSAPLGSSPSGPASDTSRGKGESPNGDGSANAAAPLRSTSTLSSAAAAAASAATSDENNAHAAAEEEESAIGGGIFKAISDAASQEGPLQGKAFDSYAFGPPVSSWFRRFFSRFGTRRERQEKRSTRLSRSRPSAASYGRPATSLFFSA